MTYLTEGPARPNKFEECTSVEQLMYQMAGAASMCWEQPEAAGAFDDRKAVDTVQQGMEKLDALLKSSNIHVPTEVMHYND